jgi:hypothetical protein
LLADRNLPFLFVSDPERQFLPGLNCAAAAHSGIRIEEFPADRHHRRVNAKGQ